MNYAIHRISLDITDDSPSQLTISAKQGDSAKILIISLLDDKKNYQIAKGSVAVFIAKKSNGVWLEHPCTIDHNSNKVIYTFKEDTVKSSGTLECEIHLSYGTVVTNEDGTTEMVTEDLTTASFVIAVHDTILSGLTDTTEEASLLPDLITKGTNLFATLEQVTIPNAEKAIADARTLAERLENGEFTPELPNTSEFVDISSDQTIDGVKYFTGFNYFGRVMELEGNASIVGSDILILTDGKIAWYRGDQFGIGIEFLPTYYLQVGINYCYIPEDGTIPETTQLKFPQEGNEERTLATREWVQQNGGGKLYRHKISIVNGSNATVGYFNVSFEVISSEDTKYVSVVDLMSRLNATVKAFAADYGYAGEYGIVRVTIGYDTLFDSQSFGIDGAVSNGTTAIAKRITTSDKSAINNFMFMDTVTEA